MPGCPLRKTCARPSDGAGQDQKPKPKPLELVGASLLAKNVWTPGLSRQHALSLTSFASKLAPTGDMYAFSCGTGFIQERASAHAVNLCRRHEHLANKFAPTLQVRATPIQSRSGSGSVFDLDLKRPVKPRQPKFDVDLEGKPAGRRFSRTGQGWPFAAALQINVELRVCRAQARHQVVGHVRNNHMGYKKVHSHR